MNDKKKTFDEVIGKGMFSVDEFFDFIFDYFDVWVYDDVYVVIKFSINEMFNLE